MTPATLQATKERTSRDFEAKHTRLGLRERLSEIRARRAKIQNELEILRDSRQILVDALKRYGVDAPERRV